MYCIIHYDGYTDATESLIPLSKDKFDQLKVAANARHELGREYVLVIRSKSGIFQMNSRMVVMYIGRATKNVSFQ